MDDESYEDDPDRVRELLRKTRPGDWFVFQTFAADGSVVVGRARGIPDRSLVVVV